MKKVGLYSLAALALAALLGGCGGSSVSEVITKTIVSQDGSVQVNVPEVWAEDTSQELTGYLVLSITDDEGTFAQISYYPDDVLRR